MNLWNASLCEAWQFSSFSSNCIAIAIYRGHLSRTIPPDDSGALVWAAEMANWVVPSSINRSLAKPINIRLYAGYNLLRRSTLPLIPAHLTSSDESEINGATGVQAATDNGSRGTWSLRFCLIHIVVKINRLTSEDHMMLCCSRCDTLRKTLWVLSWGKWGFRFVIQN